MATAVAASVLAGERPSIGFWICSFCGAMLVTFYALRQGGGRFEWGDGLLLGAVASARHRIHGFWATRARHARLGGDLVGRRGCLAGKPTMVHASSWWAFAYLSVMSMYFGFFSWNAGLALGGVAKVSQLQLLQTFVTLAISSFLVKEAIDTETLVYAAAVVGLVFLDRSFAVRRPTGVGA
jgi:drug/metabolite transporter (DMT)-like permease